jgi:hypothetical protein
MILQELEGFTHTTALDLNMGYYTIMDPTASEMCTIGESTLIRDCPWALEWAQPTYSKPK